jgi:hypothetical protein
MQAIKSETMLDNTKGRNSELWRNGAEPTYYTARRGAKQRAEFAGELARFRIQASYPNQVA